MSIRINDYLVAGNSQKVNTDWNATSGFAQLLNKPTNLVHTDGAETITNVKTFDTSPLVPNCDAGDSSFKSANTRFITTAITTHNNSELAHTFIQNKITTEKTRAEDVEAGLLTTTQQTSALLNTTINTTIPTAITNHNANVDAHPYIQGLITDEYNGRIQDINDLQYQIDGLSAAANIKDIVGTYQDLLDYDTSKLKTNDIIKVLNDSTHSNMSSYYRWQDPTWLYVGSESSSYTVAEADARFVPMTRLINNKDLYNDVTLQMSDINDNVGYTLSTDAVHKTGTLAETVTGLKTFTSGVNAEVGQDKYAQFRALSTNYGFMIRNDNSTTYFLLTNSGDKNGSWNSLRPLYINNSTGAVTCGTVWTFSQTIQGTSLNALWADLAETYLTDKTYEPGTLVQFGGDKEFTIATSKVNGVVSTKPALLMNNELKDGQPIALIGRVPVRVIGKVKKFDKIALSYIDGVGCVSKDSDNVIGRALEDKTFEDEGLVLCSVKINLD